MAYDRSLVLKASAETGVPADIIERTIAAESSGDPKATSYRGAKYGEGLMQLSEGTAGDLGVTDRDDPEQNIVGGARFLKKMYDRFGSWPLAEAAYVAGPGTVQKAGGVPKSAAAYVEKVGGKMPDGSVSTGTIDPKVATLAGGMLQEGMAEEKSSLKGYDTAVEKAKGVYSDYDKRLEENQAKLADLEKTMAKLSAQVPEAPAERKVPDYKAPQQTNPMQTLAAALPMLLLTSGAMGRNKGLALMRTMGGMLNGVDAGNEQKRKQYQEDFKEQTESVLKQATLDHERYSEILQSLQTDATLGASQAQLFAAERGIDELRVAAQTFDMKAFADRAGMAAHVAQTAGQVLTQAYQAENMALMNAIRVREADTSAQRIPPTTQAYNQAKRAALSSGKSPEEAEKAGQDALKEAEYAAHPTARAAAGRAEEKVMAADPRIKTYRTTSQYFGELDSVRPEDMNTANGQIRILDAFTKMATGGQAIRQFMATSATKYLGWMNEAQALLHRATTTQGAVMSKAAAEQYLEGAKAIREELKKTYDATLAQHAEAMDQRGIDPAQGGIPQEDLERLIASGQYKPSKGIMTRGAGAAEDKTYSVGEVIERGGKKYRVTGGDPSDPDVEPVP